MLNLWKRLSIEGRGLATSEFWMTGASIVATLAGSLAGILKPWCTALVISIVVAAYTISRGLVKARKDNNPYPPYL